MVSHNLEAVPFFPNHPPNQKSIHFSKIHSENSSSCTAIMLRLGLKVERLNQCTMGEIGLLNVTQKYFIAFFCFGEAIISCPYAGLGHCPEGQGPDTV